MIEDDQSDLRVLERRLPGVEAKCDVLLGPYSTQLMRRAGQMAAESGWLVWNHGGSGDDVEAAYPGHVVSVLTPTSRYAEPFLRHLSACDDRAELWITQGRGSFGRQVAEGAYASATHVGIAAKLVGPGAEVSGPGPSSTWDLFSAGTFEDDVLCVRQALHLPNPPRHLCAVAAGVSDFATAVDDPRGVYGVAQWAPGGTGTPRVRPTETDFLAAYRAGAGARPDYPAVQAAAAAVLAAHCVAQAGSTTRELLWEEAVELDTSTLFGSFKIDPATGTQVAHETALVQWDSAGPVRA